MLAMFWQKTGSISLGEWNHFSMQKHDESYNIFLNQKKIGATKPCKESAVPNYLSLQSNGLEISVRSIEKL